MMRTNFSLVAVATLVFSSPFLVAQTASGQAAKPSPYEGVSVPPANEAITTTEQTTPAAAPVTPPVSVAPAVAPPAVAAPPAAATSDNPDAGIIETPLPPSADDAPHSTALRTRPTASSLNASTDNTDDGIVTYVPGPANALPEGTVFRVKMLDDIDASSTKPGTPFRGQVTRDIMRDGKVVVPVGSELHGKVVYATSGNRLHGGSVLRLRPDEFVLPDGTRYHLHAAVIDTFGSDTKAKGEGNIAPDSHAKRDLIALGIGAGGGAAVGAAIGGGVGAVVGSAIGAGAYTTHWLLANRSADLPVSSIVVFSLSDPMFLTPVQDQKTELVPQGF